MVDFFKAVGTALMFAAIGAVAGAATAVVAGGFSWAAIMGSLGTFTILGAGIGTGAYLFVAMKGGNEKSGVSGDEMSRKADPFTSSHPTKSGPNLKHDSKPDSKKSDSNYEKEKGAEVDLDELDELKSSTWEIQTGAKPKKPLYKADGSERTTFVRKRKKKDPGLGS